MSAALPFLLLVLQAGPPAAITDLLARLASNLSEGNASSFLKHFDQKMKDYAGLEANVYALVDQADAGSSIEIRSDEGDDRRRALELDWILDVTPKSAAAPTERRHQRVRLELERRGKNWVITALEPVAFFAPPRA